MRRRPVGFGNVPEEHGGVLRGGGDELLGLGLGEGGHLRVVGTRVLAAVVPDLAERGVMGDGG